MPEIYFVEGEIAKGRFHYVLDGTPAPYYRGKRKREPNWWRSAINKIGVRMLPVSTHLTPAGSQITHRRATVKVEL